MAVLLIIKKLGLLGVELENKLGGEAMQYTFELADFATPYC